MDSRLMALAESTARLTIDMGKISRKMTQSQQFGAPQNVLIMNDELRTHLACSQGYGSEYAELRLSPKL